jgi:transcriptional regulator with XRE-family HTH domain
MIDPKALEVFAQALAAELARLRVDAGLSKNELATRSGLAVSFVSYLESGERQPTVASLARIAHVYGCKASDIVAAAERAVK